MVHKKSLFPIIIIRFLFCRPSILLNLLRSPTIDRWPIYWRPFNCVIIKYPSTMGRASSNGQTTICGWHAQAHVQCSHRITSVGQAGKFAGTRFYFATTIWEDRQEFKRIGTPIYVFYLWSIDNDQSEEEEEVVLFCSSNNR